GTALEFALQRATEADLEPWLESGPWLRSNRFFLEERRRNASLRLEPEQEQLVNRLAVDGQHAWGRLYDRLSGELRVQVMEKGEVVEKSPSQIRFDSPERSVRENNFFAA
ncbi:MAG: oligoendopeptidase F, partial [Planctomycetaceae bacterium]